MLDDLQTSKYFIWTLFRLWELEDPSFFFPLGKVWFGFTFYVLVLVFLLSDWIFNKLLRRTNETFIWLSTSNWESTKKFPLADMYTSFIYIYFSYWLLICLQFFCHNRDLSWNDLRSVPKNTFRNLTLLETMQVENFVFEKNTLMRGEIKEANEKELRALFQLEFQYLK